MKVLILTCLVALALARQKEELSVSTETLENLSSEESFTHINKKLEKVKHEEQQQREDQGQDKIHPVIQQQPLVYPYAEAIPYTVLPQGILTVGQLPVLPPFLQPEILETPKAKETVLPKSKAMPFLKAPTVLPAFEPQIPSFTDLKNQHLLLPPLQPVVHQVPQPFPQTPMLPPQPQLLLPQPQLLLPPQPSLQLVPQVPQPIPQQAVPYLQRDLPVPALLLYQDLVNPTRQFYPATQQLPPVYNHVNV